jgi:hypothetical protein
MYSLHMLCSEEYGIASLCFALAYELDIIICNVCIIHCISSYCGMQHGNVHIIICDSLLECK